MRATPALLTIGVAALTGTATVLTVLLATPVPAGIGLAAGSALTIERARAWRPTRVVPGWAAHPWRALLGVLAATYLLAAVPVPAAAGRVGCAALAVASAAAAWHVTGPEPRRCLAGAFLVVLAVGQAVVVTSVWWPRPGLAALAAVAVALQAVVIAVIVVATAHLVRWLWRWSRLLAGAVTRRARGRFATGHQTQTVIAPAGPGR